MVPERQRFDADGVRLTDPVEISCIMRACCEVESSKFVTASDAVSAASGLIVAKTPK